MSRALALHLLRECIPADLFTGPTEAPPADLLGDLAGHLATTFRQHPEAAAARQGCASLALVPDPRQLLPVMPNPQTPRAETVRRGYLLGVVLGLAHFCPLVESREDWLPVLPARAMSRDCAGAGFVPVRPYLLTGRGEVWVVNQQEAEFLAWQRGAAWVVEGTPQRAFLTTEIRQQAQGELRQPLPELVRLWRALCAALARLHQEGRVHGDLRPACIQFQDDEELCLLGPADGAGRTAALKRQREGKGRCVLVHEALQGDGTWLYASPQVLRGLPPTAADDVFALAVLALQLFTGDLLASRPGGSAWRAELTQRGAPAWLLGLLATMWADRREDRPHSAGELLTVIDEATSQRAVVFLDTPILEPLATASACFERMRRLRREKEAEQALYYANLAVRLEPHSAEAYRQRAICHAHAGDHLAAIDDCTRAVRLAPNEGDAWALRGFAHLELGNHAEAVSDLTRAILLPASSIPPAHPYAHRAAALIALGRLEEAYADSLQALQRRPDDPRALTVRAEVARRWGWHQIAIADASGVLISEPGNLQARRTRALTLAEHGGYQQALDDLGICLQATPHDRELLLARARLHRVWKHLPEARIDCLAILDLHPQHADALALLRDLG